LVDDIRVQSVHKPDQLECTPSIAANHRFAQLGKAGKRGNVEE
jgi:hypothetical protein